MYVDDTEMLENSVANIDVEDRSHLIATSGHDLSTNGDASFE